VAKIDGYPAAAITAVRGFKIRFPFSESRIFSPSNSRYSWFTIFVFSEQGWIHESNAVFKDFA